MQSSNHSAVHTVSSSQSNQKIELAFEQHDGAERVAIRYLTWTDGLGWCGQKTIRLDVDQLDDLHHALTAARHRIKRHHAEPSEITEAAKVIQFPTLV